MEVEFRWKGRAGLRILDQFIDGKIVEVQGLNGVGKSLAAKLLEITAGGHTFSLRSEFESLKMALEQATINITGLEHECKTLEVELTPKRWGLNPDFKIDPDTIGIFKVDGADTSAESVFPLLSVRVIRGNDTIISQMREILIRNREELDSYISIAKNNLEMINGLLEQFWQASPTDDLNVYKKAKESLLAYRDSEKEIQARVVDLEKNIASLAPLIELKDQIEQLKEADLPGLEQRMARLQQELEGKVTEQNRISEEIESVSQSVTLQSAENRARIDSILHDLDRLGKEENTLESNLVNELRALYLEIDSLEPNKVEVRLGQAEQANSEEIKELQDRWSEVQKHIDLTDVGQAIIFRLLPAIEKGLSNEIIASGRLTDLGSTELSVALLTSLIETRLTSLQEIISELPEAEFMESMEEKGLRQQRIQRALSIARSLKNKNRQISSLTSQLENIQASIDRNATERLRQLKESFEQIRQDELLAQIELSRMRDTLGKLAGYPELPVLTAKLEQEASKIGIKEEDTEYVFENQNNRLVQAKLNLEEVKDQIDRSTSLTRTSETEFKRQLNKLVQEDNYLFFIPESYHKGGQDYAAYIEGIHSSIGQFRDSCSDIVDRLDQLRRSIEIMIKQLQGQPTQDRGLEEIIQILERVYNDYFVSIYQEPEFLEYVFREYASVVRFDMGANNVVLRAADGTEVQRPLSDFSSGERAFAFSLAMIAVTAKRPTANRILILDEFAALLDYERADVLRRLVRQKVEEESLADKVIVILPAREELVERTYEVRRRLESQKEKSPQLEKELRHLEEFQQSLVTKGYYQYVWDGAT